MPRIIRNSRIHETITYTDADSTTGIWTDGGVYLTPRWADGGEYILPHPEDSVPQFLASFDVVNFEWPAPKMRCPFNYHE